LAIEHNFSFFVNESEDLTFRSRNIVLAVDTGVSWIFAIEYLKGIHAAIPFKKKSLISLI
jgi:hypothetical protein